MSEKIIPPQIKVEFDKPTAGYWDYGLRKGGVFKLGSIDGEYVDSSKPLEHPGVDRTLRWEAFELNFWFNAGSGRTWKEAASIAKRRLQNIVAVPAKVGVIWPGSESQGHLLS